MTRRSEDAEPLQREGKWLRVSFATLGEFQAEYHSNLVNGGIFVATHQRFEARELVTVELDLAFQGESVVLEGEIVTVVAPELAVAGASPGVAVQLHTPASALRARFGPFAGPPPSRGAASGDERREAPRAPAHMQARVAAPQGARGARTQDLSRTGALLELDGAPAPVGSSVRVSLVHPLSGEELEVDGRVMRHLEREGQVEAVGVRFEPRGEVAEQVERFVENVQALEHTRRLGGISGPVAELGLANLIQMLGSCSPRGTLHVQREQESGRIVFEGGMLRGVRLGGVSGMKALARLLAWRDGSFEFNGYVDPTETLDAPCPLDAAILEAVRQLDEATRHEPVSFEPENRFRVDAARLAAERSGLGKTADAVADLAAAGFPVRRILDVIPESDTEIFSALRTLLDLGIVERID